MSLLRRTVPLVLLAAILAPRAEAATKGFFERYNLGVGYAASSSYARIAYNAPLNAAVPDDCVADEQKLGTMRCTAYLAPDADEVPTPSLFLQEPFARKGLLYFDAGFTFATVTYEGALAPKPVAPATKTKTKPVPSQPLGPAYLELYGISWQGYLRVGLTPRYVPDLFVTTGVGLQTVGGKVRLLGLSRQVFVAQPDAFTEIELVFVRVSTAALSAYLGKSESITTPFGTELVADNPAGTPLTDFQLGLTSASAGLRLLLPF